MNNETLSLVAALKLYRAARVIFGDAGGLVEYCAGFFCRNNLAGESREGLLSEDALKTMIQLIEDNADELQHMDGPWESPADFLRAEEYLSWRSARSTEKPGFRDWLTMTPEEKLSFSPTIFCQLLLLLTCSLQTVL